jgi:hypothetical protein
MGSGSNVLRLRRRSKLPELRNLPLDGVDMFLLSRLDGELTLAQLTDIVAMCDPSETERRVYQLARLGLLDGPDVTTEHSGVSVARGLARSYEAEELVTLRPPPPRMAVDPDSIITVRPPAPATEGDAMDTLRPPPALPPPLPKRNAPRS